MGALQRVLLKSMVADMKLKIKTVVVLVVVMVMVTTTMMMMMASWSRRLTQRRGGEQ